jgi:hypothetical protein
MGVVLGAAGLELTSTSPEKKRRSRISVRLMAIITGRLVRSKQTKKEQISGHGSIDSRHNVQTRVW